MVNTHSFRMSLRKSLIFVLNERYSYYVLKENFNFSKIN